jgi:hypothetical protein
VVVAATALTAATRGGLRVRMTGGDDGAIDGALRERLGR